MLVLLLHMLVVLLAAIAHQAKVPILLLAMLGASVTTAGAANRTTWFSRPPYWQAVDTRGRSAWRHNQPLSRSGRPLPKA
jgi:hypothetical protein